MTVEMASMIQSPGSLLTIIRNSYEMRVSFFHSTKLRQAVLLSVTWISSKLKKI